MNALEKFLHGEPITEVGLSALGHYEKHNHVYDAECVWAIRAALQAERPLLICGEPGTGKSQLARAAAASLNRPLVSQVVTSRTEPQDLLWRYDAVARLAEAQVMSIAYQPPAEDPEGQPPKKGAAPERAPELHKLDPLNYVSPGPLWWVFNWQDAEAQRENAMIACPRPEPPSGWESKDGVVALIDEIDKADHDLPNALLESLGNGQFSLPYRHNPVSCGPDSPVPLVIITTNRERQLPAAFVRRCLVLEMALPTDSQELIAWLIKRGTAHFGAKCPSEIIREVAGDIARRRTEKSMDEHPKPGLAEYLDLLRALANFAPRDLEKQREIHQHVAHFVYEKRSAYEL